MAREKQFDWVLPVAFTPKQAGLIQCYSDKHGIPYREAVRQIFDIGAECLATGGRRVDIPALLAGELAGAGVAAVAGER